MNADDPRHGTYAGYIAGCRDSCCRSAAAAYQRRRYFDRAVLGLPPRHVDKTGTVRRVQALQRLGWSAEALSLRMGKSRAYLNVAVNRPARQWVHQRTADAVAALFDELCMTIGPSELTRRRAECSGWPPPLAWDDIDDPDEQPVMRRDSTLYRSAELVAEWDHLRQSGESIEQAARQLRVSVEAIEKAIEREQRRQRDGVAA